MHRYLRLRRFAAQLALASLLAVQAHVLVHLLGHDDDGDAGQPCQICQLALHQQSLQAAAFVEPPAAVPFPSAAAVERPVLPDVSVILPSDPRGPPLSVPA